jgi:CHAT domain-containing protein
MRPFYASLARGEPIGGSLRKAKLQMIGSDIVAYRHPYFWAGFVLNGLN